MARPHDAGHDDDDVARLDKWLWAARFFKTRALAVEAIAGGKVELNGEKPKRAKPLKLGDELRIRLGPYVHHVVVRQLGTRRGPAAVAQLLYEETEASRQERERLAERLRAAPPDFFFEKGRPTKKDRRELRRYKGDD
jgi:ribosome-associated heat shock protein Hsp15